MPHLTRFRFLMALLLTTLAARVAAAESAAAPVELCVMAFNVRYANENPGEAWPERRPLVSGLVAERRPDLLGVQEAVHRQVEHLAEDLPAYGWIGVGREGGERGEYSAIFYRRDRFEVVASGNFWLSDRPEEPGSKSWGNHFPRMVTWGRFRERATGREFLFANTHFDHQSEEARVKGAALLRERVGAFRAGLPVIVAGDFNAAAGASEPFRVLTADGFLGDTWERAARREGGGVGTFNGFKAAVPDGPRIDWILASRDVAVDRAAIDARSVGGRFPSDHFPVIAWVKIGAP